MKYTMMAGIFSAILMSAAAHAQTADRRVPVEPSPPQPCVTAKWTEIAVTDSVRPAKLFGCLVNGVHKPEIKHQKACLRLNTCSTPKTGR